MATTTDGTVEHADKGYVMGIDFAGPFDPNVNGIVYDLFGVEVGHTNYGMVEMLPARPSKNAKGGVKRMVRELHTVGPNPKELVRLH